jgi:hypothetical protein
VSNQFFNLQIEDEQLKFGHLPKIELATNAPYLDQ